MPRINLLPWRAELRRQRRTEYLIALGICAVVAVAVLATVDFYYNALIDQQNTRNNFLTEKITELDKKIAEIKQLEKEKENLIARMKAIEQLQTSRPYVVHLFDELVSTLPDGVYLTSVQQSGDVVTLKGVAQSNARVSNYMRNIESSIWLKDPKLTVIQSKTQTGRRIADFTLTLKQNKPKSGKDEQEEQL
jgi:type IV pilus assembly protein PilN